MSEDWAAGSSFQRNVAALGMERIMPCCVTRAQLETMVDASWVGILLLLHEHERYRRIGEAIWLKKSIVNPQ